MSGNTERTVRRVEKRVSDEQSCLLSIWSLLNLALELSQFRALPGLKNRFNKLSQRRRWLGGLLQITIFFEKAMLRVRGNIDIKLSISQFDTLHTLINRNFEDGKRVQTSGLSSVSWNRRKDPHDCSSGDVGRRPVDFDFHVVVKVISHEGLCSLTARWR